MSANTSEDNSLQRFKVHYIELESRTPLEDALRALSEGIKRKFNNKWLVPRR